MIITRGGEETIALHQSGEVVRVKPLPVTPVDTVGAGDSFTGALAVALGEGRSVFDRLDFANAAGALATLVPGAQPAMPTRDAILQFLDNRP
jgi:ribokinase